MAADVYRKLCGRILQLTWEGFDCNPEQFYAEYENVQDVKKYTHMTDSEEYDSYATYCSEIEGPKAVGVPLPLSTPVHGTEFNALFDC
ncbi:Hypp2868 [Branchiostoma lanceolatum]|uniref:Hypp2868 protein n=1 Tax=Branchiostoma lanceolatum TaxID=7740 RepID=A0A8K0EUT0_BRALA|nr:Hypp2868 [Branchiostoma lanceolatum]